MTKTKIEHVKTSLEMEEDIGLHLTGWIVQRVGWVIMLVFLICAGIGLFGTGLLSQKVTSKDGHTVTYEQFSRYENKNQLQIMARSAEGKVQLSIPQLFLKNHELENMVPEPDHRTIRNGSNVYTFSSDQQALITLYIVPKKVGNNKSVMTVNGTEFEIKNYIFP